MRSVLLGAFLLCALGATRAAADEVSGATRTPTFRSGYGSVPALGGPNSTNSALRGGDASTEEYYRTQVLRRALDPYYAFKRRLNDRFGVALGLDYNVLYQVATDTQAEDQAAGGVFRFYANWTVFGKGRPTNGHLVFRIENRHRLGTALAPTELGGAIGSLFGTATSFDGWEWGITNLQWQQLFAGGRYAIAIGQVDARDWVDVFPLSNWRTALLSPAVMYPVTKLPSAGLGGAGHAYFREGSTPYVMAGIFDANGHPYAWGGDTFFGDREYYTVVSAGWAPSFKRRFDDNVRVTYWHQDARKKEGSPSGWGLTFDASWRFAKHWTPFVRGGYAEGGVVSAKGAAVVGVGYHFRSHDLVGAAIGWGTPWKDGLRDQITTEFFYRFELSPNFNLSPDVQIIIDPSENEEEDVIGVFGIRAQLVL